MGISNKPSFVRYTPPQALAACILAVTLGMACSNSKKESPQKGASANAGASTGTGTGSSNNSNPCLHLTDSEDVSNSEESISSGTNTGSTSSGNASSGTANSSGTATGDITPISSTNTGCSPGTSTGSSSSGENSDSDPSTGGDTGWNAGPGLDSCRSDGKAYIAVGSGGSAASCGDPLVSWCCSEAEAVRLFPAYKTKLEAEFKANNDKGLKLYDCSQVNGKTTFHFATGKSDSVQYRTYFISSVSSATSSGSCSKPTAEDLNLPAGDSSSDSEDDGSGTSTGTGSGSAASLSDLSQAGILAYLQTSPKPYESWTSHDSAVRTSTGNSPHGKIKTFYNDTLKQSHSNGVHTKNSVAVAEMYDTNGSTLKGYLVMGKSKDGNGADSWNFFQLTGLPSFSGVPTYGAGSASSVSACVSCHQNQDIDFIRGTPP